MRRDGRNFRIAPTLMFFTPTPEQVKDLQAQNYLPQGEIRYDIPAKVVPDNSKRRLPNNCLETRRKWSITENPVMATPIQVTGWSGSCMPYVRIGGREKVLLFCDGRVYSAPL